MQYLCFRPGETNDFTSKILADKKEGYDIAIRELFQNSLDASDGKTCEVNIYIEKINKKDIPNISDYEYSLKKAISFHKKRDTYKENAQNMVKAIKEALSKEELEVLIFTDNGKGMPPEIIDNLISERHSKEDDSAGYKDENIAKGNVRRVLAETPENHLNPEYTFTNSCPDFIAKKMEKFSNTVSIVVILGLTPTFDSKKTDLVNYCIASNFFYVVNENRLLVNIHQQDAKSKQINKDYIGQILEHKKDEKNTNSNNILSGRDLYILWEVIQNKDTRTKKEIIIDDKNTVTIYIKNKIETNSFIALVRKGMLIARHDNMLSKSINNLRKDANFEFFCAVISVDYDTCPELFNLLKSSEAPYHNKLEKGRLGKSKENRLISILDKLSDEIKKYLIIRERDSSAVIMPFLDIPINAKKQGSNLIKPRSTKSKVAKNKKSQKSPIANIRSMDGGDKIKGSNIRVINSRNSFKYKEVGSNFVVNMNIKLQKAINNKDNIYFSVILAKDNYDNSRNSFLLIKNILLNDNKIKLPKRNNKEINLGHFKRGIDYKIIATIEKPKEINNLDVALKPFIGAKEKRSCL